MTLPDQPGGSSISSTTPYPVTGNDGSVTGLPGRTQASATADLKAQILASPGWTGATAAVWQGLERGISLPLAIIRAIVQNFTGLVEQFPVVGDALKALEAYSAGLRQFLGELNPLAVGYDVEAAAQHFVTSILAPFAHLLGPISPGQISPTAQNMQIASGFDTADSICDVTVGGQSVGSWDDSVGDAAPGSLKIIADGTVRAYRGNKIAVIEGQTLTVTGNVMWAGLVSTGTPIVLGLCMYSAGVLVETAQVGSVTSPAADSNGWVTLTNDITITAGSGIDTVRTRLLVDKVATAGVAHWDDCSDTPTGLINNAAVGGIGGVDLGSTLNTMTGDIQNTWNYLTSGLENAAGTIESDLAHMADAAAAAARNALSALGLGTAARNTLATVTNNQVGTGLEETVESNIDIHHLGTGSTPTSIAITQAASAGGFWRATQAKKIGFWQCWFVSISGTVSAFYINFGKMDSTGEVTPLFSSNNLSLELNSGAGWLVYTFPGVDEFDVTPSDVIVVEYQVVGSGTVNMAGQPLSWLTQNHPTANTARTGFTRNTGASGPTPLSIAAGSIPWSGNTPYIGLGVANVPPDFQPGVTIPFRTAGTQPWTAPDWFDPSTDIIDVIALGAGGGANIGQPGGNTVVTIGGTIITAPGGAGGDGSAIASAVFATGHGPTPNPYSYNETPYYSGVDVPARTVGSAPGGGGGGGSYGFSSASQWGQGGGAGSWVAQSITAPGVTSGTVEVGAGGTTNGSHGSQPGASGAAWLVFRQAGT